jgi:hypothetical protein
MKLAVNPRNGDLNGEAFAPVIVDGPRSAYLDSQRMDNSAGRLSIDISWRVSVGKMRSRASAERLDAH